MLKRQIDTANWMRDAAQFIENKSIKNIMIAGTHDSATYALEHIFGKGQDITHILNHLKFIGVGLIVTAIAKKISEPQYRTIQQGRAILR